MSLEVIVPSLQDEGQPPLEEHKEDLSSGLDSELSEEELAAIAKEEETPEKPETPETPEVIPPVVPVVPVVPSAVEEELASLRAISREQKRVLAVLETQNKEFREALEKAEIIPPVDEEAIRASQEAFSAREMQLQTLLEAMKLNSAYADVEEVVSQDKFDTLVSMMAANIVQSEGGNQSKIEIDLTSAIWAQPNPYRYMYDRIKEFHPSYAKKVEAEAPPKEELPKAVVDKKPVVVPAKVPDSIVNIPGGAGTKGWTSAMIDALDEYELAKVPKDVYELYLKNDLA